MGGAPPVPHPRNMRRSAVVFPGENLSKNKHHVDTPPEGLGNRLSLMRDRKLSRTLGSSLSLNDFNLETQRFRDPAPDTARWSGTYLEGKMIKPTSPRKARKARLSRRMRKAARAASL